MFALMFATYFYLRTRSTDWPPGHLPPALKYGAANAVIFLREHHSRLDREETGSGG